MTVHEALQAASATLQHASDNARYEARRLLSFVLGCDTAWLFAHPEAQLTSDQQGRFNIMLKKRAAGEPLAYLLGAWGFYHWDFVVNKHVLIPRPETEVLVEAAADWVREHHPDGKLSIIDVGTGSGIIAISMALLFPAADVLAVDISPAALEVARLNARRLAATNVHFEQSNLLSDIPPRPTDLLLANLPYIDHDELATLPVRHYEPVLALDGGQDGLILVERLLHECQSFVKPGSGIFLEIGADQSAATKALVEQIFTTESLQVLQDFAERDRVVKFNLT